MDRDLEYYLNYGAGAPSGSDARVGLDDVIPPSISMLPGLAPFYGYPFPGWGGGAGREGSGVPTWLLVAAGGVAAGVALRLLTR